MKHITLALILSACAIEPTNKQPQANLDAVLDGEQPLMCKSNLLSECGPRPDRNLMPYWNPAQCGERPEYKPTAEWIDDIDRWAKCVAEFIPTERWTHDIDLWSMCAEYTTPSLAP